MEPTKEARDLVADAPVLRVVALLEDIDPDGEWSANDGEESLRSRAADLAHQAVVDGILDVPALAAILRGGA